MAAMVMTCLMLAAMAYRIGLYEPKNSSYPAASI